MPQGQMSMGNGGPVPNMGNMGMPPQYSRMAMTPTGIQPITSQRRPSTLQYQPAPQNQTSMPGNPLTPGSRYMPVCDNPGMTGPGIQGPGMQVPGMGGPGMQGPGPGPGMQVDQKPMIDPMGMPMPHMKQPMNNCNSPMMDIKPQISEFCQ